MGRPDAVSPEITEAPSTWPPGWVIEPQQDGTASLAWRSRRKALGSSCFPHASAVRTARTVTRAKNM
jgi:hypothetical protein